MNEDRGTPENTGDATPGGQRLWPLPCPAWCTEHQDYPADPRRDAPAYAHHGRVVATWPSTSSTAESKPQKVTLGWFCYDDPDNPSDGPYISALGHEFLMPSDARQVVAGLTAALDLIDAEKAVTWRERLAVWWRRERRLWYEMNHAKPDAEGSYDGLILSWRRRGLIRDPDQQAGRWGGKGKPRRRRN